jgi:DNA/RNA-binding domain of Phe-tRNA-synthetase-like protein
MTRGEVTVTGFPPVVTHELEGWALFWADLEAAGNGEDALATLRREVAQRVRASFTVEALSAHPTVAALRKLFRRAGCDPTRYRPSSEALLRRLLKGEEMPAIHPMVDINNCLSAELAVPVCTMDTVALRPPFVLRAGLAGEAYLSLRGPFNLEGKPLLADREGPCDAPITGGERVKVRAETVRAWLVAYLPAAALDGSCADAALRALLDRAPVVRVRATATTVGGSRP